MGHFDEPPRKKVDESWKYITIFLIVIVGLLVVALICMNEKVDLAEGYNYDMCRLNNDLVNLVNMKGEIIEECRNVTIDRMTPMDCTLFD